MRMTLLIAHSATLNHQKTSKHVGSLEGEFCISSAILYEQTTKLCLAYSNHQPPPRYLSSVLLRAKRYTVLLTEESSAPVSMSPTIIEDVASRTLEREWDILAIVANCCQYSNRLDSTKLQHGKQSLSLSLLALCLINGEIFSNHPEDDFDARATRSMTITQLLHKHFFQGLESPRPKAKLTFNKSCRFSNVVLTDVGVKTEGYLWRLDDEIPTTDFRRYSPPHRRKKKQLRPEKRPLEWLVDELAGQYPELSHRLYEVLELNTPLTPSEEWLLSMAKKVEEAIEEGKDLFAATLLGPGPLGVAIFVCQPEENSGSSNESDESSELGSLMSFDNEEEEECYVFTSFQPAKYSRQGFDLNDLDKHVSIEVDCDFGMGDGEISRLSPMLLLESERLAAASPPDSDEMWLYHTSQDDVAELYRDGNGIWSNAKMTSSTTAKNVDPDSGSNRNGDSSGTGRGSGTGETDTTADSSSAASLATGARVGIGVSVGMLVVATATWILLRKRRQTTATTKTHQPPELQDTGKVELSDTAKFELSDTAKFQLSDTAKYELPGDTSFRKS
ncbi:uncharacterized protein FTOL_00749 [Fusarium torulosum]|uniref:Uncharacterized protein n=1 Tax=Fusarium torulosum TaxID=33205 RepID=A0AAE8LYN8_9HYPO|nr:uncharacterized protein FTOL_00749 [Fusarium torulosum]